MRTRSHFALALALTLAACGGGGSDPAAANEEGYAALGSGKYANAASHFQTALDAIGSDTSNAQYLRASMGLIETNVHVDPERAKDDFLALASASPQVNAKDYSRIGGMLAGAKQFQPAIAVVDAGIKAYPETPALEKMIEQISADAEKSGDAEAINALKGLGYLGD